MYTQATELNRILEIIGRIAETTADGDIIYRGETEPYEHVSSSLWRECQEEIGIEEFEIETVQERMIVAAKDYTYKTARYLNTNFLQRPS